MLPSLHVVRAANTQPKPRFAARLAVQMANQAHATVQQAKLPAVTATTHTTHTGITTLLNGPPSSWATPIIVQSHTPVMYVYRFPARRAYSNAREACDTALLLHQPRQPS